MPHTNDTFAREIMRIRLSQMAVNEEYKAKKFKIPIHLAMGHEAVAVALSDVMQDKDRLLLTHRNIAYHLARVPHLRPILDEYFQRPSGLAKGRFGSMNLLHPERGIVYTSSILGNQFPVATGMAMMQKNLGEKAVTVVLAGDGSIEEGSFYESLLFSASLKLPVIFLVENNEWSLGTSIAERRCPIDLASLAKSVGAHYLKLEGNDVEAYRTALADARASVIGDEIPLCIDVTVSTLGDWRADKTPENPEGRFINYHSGPAPTISIAEWPVVEESDNDPVFALLHHYDKQTLESIAKEEYALLQKELI